MPLDDYHAKRRFDRTPEPKESTPGPSPGGLRFVVQKHDATRLHYDFRLELDGVLKSWSVPKGPSLDPADKRLAIPTEDHPLSYARFEGVIPKGEYGGGPVLVWDEGIWIPDGDPRAAFARGSLTFRLEGEKLTGGWRLVRSARKEGKKEAWLLLKRNDSAVRRGTDVPIVESEPRSVLSRRTVEEVAAGLDAPAPFPGTAAITGARRGPLPAFVAPQLATALSEPPRGVWLVEVKHDGYRMQLRRKGGAVTLRTRQGLDWTARFPSVARAVAGLPGGDLLLDAEVVVLDAHGRSSFSALQRHMRDPAGRFVAFVFDLLHLDGWDLRGAPLSARKCHLHALIGDGHGTLRYSAHLDATPEAFFREACALGLEGMVCKSPSAPYTSGRSRLWSKVACVRRQEFVVVGYTDPKGSRPGIGALLLGVGDGGGLRYAGKVGTGFSEEDLRRLHGMLAPLVRSEAAVRDAPRWKGAHWVAPAVVAEIAFRAWTAEGMVRHASFKGIREDKRVDEVVWEAPPPGPPETPRRRRPSVVAGVTISTPDRVLFADPGITKIELARALEALASRMLPVVAGRPLTLFRGPDGLDGPTFWQKHDKQGMPDALGRVRFPGDDDDYLVVEDVAGLVSLAQVSTLEVHVHGMRAPHLDAPDRMVFDLDPGPDVSWARVAATAMVLRERLEAMGLVPFLRATGGKGLHVVVPIAHGPTWQEVKDFTHGMALFFAERDPDGYTASLTKERRGGRIFIDYLRNTLKATAIASWSTRARPGAPVAVPMAWSELDPGAAGPPVVGLRQALTRPAVWEDLDEAARPLPTVQASRSGARRRRR